MLPGAGRAPILTALLDPMEVPERLLDLDPSAVAVLLPLNPPNLLLERPLGTLELGRVTLVALGLRSPTAIRQAEIDPAALVLGELEPGRTLVDAPRELVRAFRIACLGFRAQAPVVLPLGVRLVLSGVLLGFVHGGRRANSAPKLGRDAGRGRLR